MAANNEVIRNHAAFMWSAADLLRGDYKRSEYCRSIRPFVVLRRLDCVLEPTKDQLFVKALAETAASTGSSQIHVNGDDVCRVDVSPSCLPVDATVVVDKGGQLQRKTDFCIRVGNGTREISDPAERQKHVASRWGSQGTDGP